MKPKLLVLELWGLGDLAIATPFLRAAARDYEVTLLAQPGALQLRPHLWPELRVIPFIPPWTAFRGKYRLWQWPWKELAQMRRRLRVESFDSAVSGRRDPRDHLLLKLSGARERLGFSRLNSGIFLTRPLALPDSLAHRYENWRVLGAALGLTLPSRTELPPAPRTPSPVVLLHSGARLPARVWPLENVLAIARRLRMKNHPVQIACDPAQLDWWRARGETAACPRTVTELMALFEGAGVFIGNDSGPGHLAAICGLPTFTLFGPQRPEWFTPLHPAAAFYEGRPCAHKPCSDYCRFEKPFCLTDVTPEEVWPRLESFVSAHLPA